MNRTVTTPMEPTQKDVVQGRERIGLAFAVAVLIAGVVLVIAVLPAEFGVDPTGIGHALGLNAMAEVKGEVAAFEKTRGTGAETERTVAPQDGPFHQETVELTVKPGEFVEYKYRLDKGQALLFSWRATARVNYEFHAEPDGAPRGYAETYEKSTGETASGTLTAPFAGIHGWYWENTTPNEVTVTLSAAGFFPLAHEFRKDTPTKTKMFQ